MGGKFPPGSRFPTRRLLADKHQLAPMTVQRALGILQKEGWLVSGNGVPTLVANPLPLVAVHTHVIEGVGELYTEDGGRVGVVELVVDDDAPSSVYVRLHNFSSAGDHHELQRLAGERLRVTVQVLKPPRDADDDAAAVVLTLPGKNGP